MPEPSDRPTSRSDPASTTVSALLGALALASAGTGTAIAAALLVDAVRHGLAVHNVLAAIACAVGGASVAGLLIASAWLVTRLAREPSGDRPEPPPDLRHELRALLRATDETHRRLDQLEDLLRLGPEELARRRAQARDEQTQADLEQVRSLLAGGEPYEAARALDAFVAEQGQSEQTAELRKAIVRLRAASREQTPPQRAKMVEDLMAVSRFDEALEEARQLAEEQPDDASMSALLARVQRERDAYRAERIARLYNQVERHVSARQWDRALADARELIEAYPDAPQARQVRGQIETLQDNARIQAARAMGARIRDLIARRRFAEALTLAEELIEHHPDTAAAEDLRRQLPRLRERAQQ
jgi:tetratricopeptide (TPR) repeat protein